MPTEPQRKVELEIAHVLFIDVVGYSKLLVSEASALVARLTQIAKATSHLCAAKEHHQPIRLATGDGMAFVFFHSPEAPVHCALEITKAVQEEPRIPVRMGIHSGPVEMVRDVNDLPNVAGAGMNIAQRIMNCGDEGHILLSQRVADDLAQTAHWRPYLHKLGEIEVKHGVCVSVVNLHGEKFGNPRLPVKIKHARRLFSLKRETVAGRRHRDIIAALLLVGAIAVAISVWSVSWRGGLKPALPTNSIPGKSIAVLPFDNFSDDKQNAYFADGIQDDILTALSKVSDLKVISRSSVMQYRGGARNSKEIGQSLGVAYLLEGSVRRANNKVRVTAQLIDARSDAHVWAEDYDRNLADVFAIQREVAEQIVAQLKANLSSSEKAALVVQPTKDLQAFDLYLQAKSLINSFHDTADWKETLLKAQRLLGEAIARDGNFALAYCWYAQASDSLYWFRLDHTAARLAEARAMAEKALTLMPELGEAHLAQAVVHYHGSRDYASALRELATARRLLPNTADVYAVTGWIDRRQGRWDDALKNEEKAVELDPRNSRFLNDLAVLYDLLRRYNDEEKVFARAIAANPASTNYFQLMRSQVELQKGNVATTRSTLGSLPADYDPDGATTVTRINLALAERDPPAAEKLLAASKLEELVGANGLLLPRSWFEALIARARGDALLAERALNVARTKLETKLRDQPDDAILLAMLGIIDAGLGRKEQASGETQRALELRPVTTDALDGATVLALVALSNVWAGEHEDAINRLAFFAKAPGGPDYGQLKLDPAWDAVRSNPRFNSVVASLAPR